MSVGSVICLLYKYIYKKISAIMNDVEKIVWRSERSESGLCVCLLLV